MHNTPIVFEEDIALDSDGTLDFHVAGSLSQSDGFSLTLTSSSTKRGFSFKTQNPEVISQLCTSENVSRNASLKMFFNACKNLLTKPANPNSGQQLGYFFYTPKSNYSFDIPYGELNSLGKKSPDYKNAPSAHLYLKFNCYDSLNDEHFSFFIILEQFGVESAEGGGSLSANQDLVLFESRVKKMIDGMASRINSLIEENSYWKSKALEGGQGEKVVSRGAQQQKKKDTKDPVGVITTHSSGTPFILDDSLPFVFGVLSRAEDSIAGNNDPGIITNQLGQWYNNGAEYMASLLCGTHAYGNQYANFNVPPSIRFLQGSNGIFLFKEQHVCYSNAVHYQYSRAMLGMFFIKNETNQQKTFAYSFGGTSQWSSGYEGASVFLGTPDKNNSNANQISAVNWQNLWSNSSSNENLSASVNVTVPADTTVSLLMYTSSFYHTAANNFQSLYNGWKCFNLRPSLVNAGLKIDIERTLKSNQSQGNQNFYSIWN